MMEHDFQEGVRLFNEQRYFEAHEALEGLWLKAIGGRKTFLHGLIQVATAFHHQAQSNLAGFRSLLEKGCTKLVAFGAEFDGIDLSALMQQLHAWREFA
jgi:uncharacterized protein